LGCLGLKDQQGNGRKIKVKPLTEKIKSRKHNPLTKSAELWKGTGYVAVIVRTQIPGY